LPSECYGKCSSYSVLTVLATAITSQIELLQSGMLVNSSIATLYPATDSEYQIQWGTYGVIVKKLGITNIFT
ncbi:hypothetical protein KBT16_03705, partial [Nostoc sp. CCCryo 231-06]|nr:hypothetical protein [Nostoc sp. CCCryo 231-06]